MFQVLMVLLFLGFAFLGGWMFVHLRKLRLQEPRTLIWGFVLLSSPLVVALQVVLFGKASSVGLVYSLLGWLQWSLFSTLAAFFYGAMAFGVLAVSIWLLVGYLSVLLLVISDRDDEMDVEEAGQNC